MTISGKALRKGRQILLFASLMLLMHSCVLYPPYREPDVDVPVHWRFDADESSTFANLEWWENFGDPVLDCLIEHALHYYNDIKVAICNIYQFYANFGIVKSRLSPQIFGNS